MTHQQNLEKQENEAYNDFIKQKEADL